MSALIEVFTIAVGTAVLAALIVAADWDLGVIRAWQTLTTSNAHRDHHSTGWSALGSASESATTSVGAYSGSSRFEGTDGPLIAPRHTDRTEAEEWLAAAAARRLPEFNRTDPRRWAADESVALPAVPLRDVLAARRADRPVDAEAA